MLAKKKVEKELLSKFKTIYHIDSAIKENAR